MPVDTNANGHFRYVSHRARFYKERPEDFLGTGDEYEKRLQFARQRVLNAIAFARTPLSGRGTCHEIFGVGDRIESITDFVDRSDRRRSDIVRQQRKRAKQSRFLADERRIRSPQDVKRRRSALISGSEICPNFFKREYGFRETKAQREQFVDLMRWWLLYEAIDRMIDDNELFNDGSVWYVPVSVIDGYGPARQARKRKSLRSSKRTKRDDRSFHGRPNRERGRVAA